MKILCATDLLPKSEAAIERAGLLADQLGADLTLLHVVVPGESERALEQTLQTALAHTRSRAQPPLWRAQRAPNVAVRAGSPARIILDTVAQSKARLLVLGPHRKRPLRDALEGTIAEKALAARNCPVLVVQDEARGPYRRVLLALDLSEASASAIRAAESLVLAPEVDARIVHAHEPPYQGMLHYADVGMDRPCVTRMAGDARRNGPFAICSSTRAPTSHGTTFMSSNNRRPSAFCGPSSTTSLTFSSWAHTAAARLRRALVGSVANRVLHETNCDVLIVPEGSFGASRSKSVFGARRPRALAEESRSTVNDPRLQRTRSIPRRHSRGTVE